MLKRKKKSNNYPKTATWKTTLGSFVFVKNQTQSLLGNEVSEASYLY